ncbi:alpha/beta fold hydrolase [Sphingomonas aracearum]|uniref:Alpha/beta hydrolase n=1 Tax=Sphingomonas aracearum TaxID=2283317 RepID=A0A369VXZ5_9SPHN|nr:alpha/beta fold hydrolase [Sphingomonas aracearum]RDE06709.1 alpha/beta hydrolase [Sphingomonas aracearum]
MLRSETAANAARRSVALAGLRAYQDAPRAQSYRAGPVRYRKGRARLRDGGGQGRPVVFVPSLINPPFILDLTPETSLMGFVRDAGFHPWLLDWGEPTPADRDMDVTGHVERLLLPLLARLPEPPVLVGYCLGGTMALAAACASRLAGLALVAAPWRFSGFGERAVGEIAALWDAAQPACEALGLVPMEVLQAGFWRLDPARTIAKYERLAGTDPASPEFASFVALEDWANAGAPLTYAAGRQMFDDFFAADLPGSGRWTVGGGAASSDALPCPAIEFVSLTDRIVPAASAANLPNRRDLGAGHVGMVVGRGARAQLWEPLVHWLNALPAAI